MSVDHGPVVIHHFLASMSKTLSESHAYGSRDAPIEISDDESPSNSHKIGKRRRSSPLPKKTKRVQFERNSFVNVDLTSIDL